LILVACGGDGEQGNNSSPSNDHPLFDMLRRTPMRFADSELYYLDFRAVEDALPYVDRPAEGEVSYDNWMGYTMRWYAIPLSLGGMFTRVAEESLTTVGMEFRQIDRTLTFGDMPEVGTIWSGDFDETAIRFAHIARGYETVRFNEAEAWCYDGECSNGMEINSQGREQGNIFDPQLGRKVPFLLTDNQLISSPQQALLEEITAPNAQTLYNAPNVLTLAQAATAPEGLLVNWMVLPVADADIDPVVALGDRITSEQHEEYIANIGTVGTYVYQNLPPYRAVGIADRQEGERMVCLQMLVYDDSATAETAATELSTRVENFSDYMIRKSDTPIFTAIQGMTITHSVYTSPTTGLFVAIVRMDYDTPTSEQAHAPMGCDEAYLPDARAFRYVWDGFVRRGFYPLWTLWNQ